MGARRHSFALRRFAPRASAAATLISAAIGLTAGLAVVFGPVLGGLEQGALSTRFQLRGTSHPSGVAVVAIDDRSFAILHHRWPFPRSWHGEVLRRLRAAGARAVFYDVQFTEPTTAQEDGALFDALGQTGGAVLATTETNGHGQTGVLGGDANLRLVFSRAAISSFPVEVGGVVDRVPYEVNGVLSAAVAVAARVTGHRPGRRGFGAAGAYIDYQGPPGTFPTLSFADVLRGHFASSAVRGKVVVVGATSSTLQDVHATPQSSHQLMSGPEIQANAIWTVLHGEPLTGAPAWLTVVLVALGGALAPLVRWRRSAKAVAVLVPLTALAYLVADQLSFDAGLVLPVVAPLIALGASGIATLVSSHLLVNAELRVTQSEIVHRLARAAESRDGDIGRHLERMAFLCERLALAAGMSRAEARLLRKASALHDVGKIGIPDTVLLKVGRFSSGEREVMEGHTALGAGILAESSTGLLQMAEAIARTHHERWDGSGYPAGLAGEEIPLAGRICAICDVFDALISRRRYKERWSLEAALDELQLEAGRHFDPRLAALFAKIAPKLYAELRARVDPDLEDIVPAIPWLRRRRSSPAPPRTPRQRALRLGGDGARRPGQPKRREARAPTTRDRGLWQITLAVTNVTAKQRVAAAVSGTGQGD